MDKYFLCFDILLGQNGQLVYVSVHTIKMLFSDENVLFTFYNKIILIQNGNPAKKILL